MSPFSLKNNQMSAIDFTRVFKILDKAINLDESAVWLKAVDEEVKEHIIQMNTEDQLEEDGIYSDGTPTGEYSPFTIAIKRAKGDRYDHITFKDTGNFYDSWTVRVDRNGIEIDADGQVSADTNLFEFYSEDILGLTKENIEVLTRILLDNYIKIIRDELLS